MLLSVETGSRLYRGSEVDGTPIEDEGFGSYLQSLPAGEAMERFGMVWLGRGVIRVGRVAR